MLGGANPEAQSGSSPFDAVKTELNMQEEALMSSSDSNYADPNLTSTFLEATPQRKAKILTWQTNSPVSNSTSSLWPS
jgi:hypothetical protein